ncbi:MAG TPA: hypothetical protein VLE53_15165 [Gemmatimonadaceae bacterium]|nr:hypothetical protein [Gemmatimonadaceae bacterium]
MAHLTPQQYDRLERAIADGRRIVVSRGGREIVVIPRGLRLKGGREEIEARHPTTGDRVVIAIDDMDSFEVVSW